MSFETKFLFGIPMGEAAAFYLKVKTAEGEVAAQAEFTAPPEQVLPLMGELVVNEFKTMMAYEVYAQSLRDLSHLNLADEFQEHAEQETEHAEWLLRRMAVLGGAISLPDVPAPPPATDPVQIIQILIDYEQAGIDLWNQLHSLVGETPSKYKIEEFLTHEQHHLDELKLLLPASELTPPPEVPKMAGVKEVVDRGRSLMSGSRLPGLKQDFDAAKMHLRSAVEGNKLPDKDLVKMVDRAGHAGVGLLKEHGKVWGTRGAAAVGTGALISKALKKDEEKTAALISRQDRGDYKGVAHHLSSTTTREKTWKDYSIADMMKEGASRSYEARRKDHLQNHAVQVGASNALAGSILGRALSAGSGPSSTPFRAIEGAAQLGIPAFIAAHAAKEEGGASRGALVGGLTGLGVGGLRGGLNVARFGHRPQEAAKEIIFNAILNAIPGIFAGATAGNQMSRARDQFDELEETRLKKEERKKAREAAMKISSIRFVDAFKKIANPEFAQLTAVEEAGAQAQAQNESEFFRQKAQAAEQQAQAQTEAQQQLQAQVQQLQQQLAGSDAQIQASMQQAQMAQQAAMQNVQQAQQASSEATMQALQNQSQALQYQQLAANMRMGMQQLRGDVLNVASQDPAAGFEQQLAEVGANAQTPPPGPVDPSTGIPQEGPAVEAGDPNAQMPAEPASQAAGPAEVTGVTPQPELSTPTGAKEASFAQHLVGAAVGGGLGAGAGALEAYGGLNEKLRQRVNQLEAVPQGERSFGQAMSLAKAKAHAALSGVAEEHPRASMLASTLAGAMGGAVAGPHSATLFDKGLDSLKITAANLKG